MSAPDRSHVVAQTGGASDPARLMHATNLICTPRRQLTASTVQPPLSSTTARVVAASRPTGRPYCIRAARSASWHARGAVRDVFEQTTKTRRRQSRCSTVSLRRSPVSQRRATLPALLIEFRRVADARSFAARNSIFTAIIPLPNTAGNKRVSLGCVRSEQEHQRTHRGIASWTRRRTTQRDRSTTTNCFSCISIRVFCRSAIYQWFLSERLSTISHCFPLHCSVTVT